MPIHQRLYEVLKNTGYVQKTGKNNEQRYSYASDADMLREVRPAMVEAGVLCYPIALEQHVGKTPSEKQVLINGNATFRFQDAEDGSFIDMVVPFCGSDSTDKAGWKGATGARKYALKLAFSLETGDDPEKDAAPDAHAIDTSVFAKYPKTRDAEQERGPKATAFGVVAAEKRAKAAATEAKEPFDAWLKHGQVLVRDITPVESAAYAGMLHKLGLSNAEACKLIGVESMKKDRADATLDAVIQEVAVALAEANAGRPDNPLADRAKKLLDERKSS